MKAQLSEWLERLRASYWFIPSLAGVLAIALSYGMVRLDHAVRFDVQRSYWLYTGHASGALEVLSTIATAMITIASLTFSVTIVAMTLAISQYGSRLLYNFMRDRANQVVLGVFIGAFLYSLLVLRTIEGDGAEFVPQLSVTLALVWALGGVAALIYFIHHTAEVIQADNVIDALRREFSRHVTALFPPAEQEAVHRDDAAQAERRWEELEPASATVRSNDSGFVQVVDVKALLRLAADEDLVIRVLKRPGEFVTHRTELLAVYPAARIDAPLRAALHRAIVTGAKRTLVQDVELPLQELAEVAVRGLSPGVYDPFTALRVVDRLGDALMQAMEHAEPRRVHRDADGTIRVWLAASSFASICDAALLELRDQGAQNTLVMQRLLEMLAHLVRHARTEAQRTVLVQHARLIHEAASARARDDVGRSALERAHAAVVKAALAAGNTSVHAAYRDERRARVQTRPDGR